MNLKDLPFTGTTHSEAGTVALASAFAACLEPGDVVLLQGELGAGKTNFVRGLCIGLGMADAWEVDSPTYTVVNHYDAGPGLDHLDLYRFSDPAELDEIGFEEMLASPSIVVIEWPERLAGYPLPGHPRLVRLEILDANSRTVNIFSTVPEG
ncbi:MAG: tRNA (adenosine(37)-N6)-threonylcarbamoyltransferase complex ATPase subunit type 1 TsaE [Acidobacteriota bacterium]|nr:tRNA (adenosine(37)-N6)-threonylcarbamoyltransferase complex ATPase subunit type 1 TsaE [Acidobacteriota bacterium]